MSKSRGILPPKRFWTEAERELLRRHYHDTLTADIAAALGRPVASVHRYAAKLGLKRDREHIAALARERLLDPNHGGHRTRFQKGSVPANKGKKMPEGWAPGDMARTQFKKGLVPHTWKPVGTYTVNSEGYIDLKVNDDPGPRHVRWKPVHRLVWERANGPVPAGHAVVFKPGRHTTDPELITLDAVELLTRAQLMERNSFHWWPKPLADLVIVRSHLTRHINKLAKEAETP